MTLEVRRLSAVDESVAAVFARLIPQLSSSLRVPAIEELRVVVESPNAALFAACDGDRIVGVLTLVWYDVPSGRKAWIEDVVVDGACRGCGAGEALVQAAVGHARQVGANKVMLTSNAARTAAHALYRKSGFEVAETTVFALKIEK